MGYSPSEQVAKRKVDIRLDLQVLRALAVISVVAYHLFPDFIPSGLLGVDVFFLLSGYLITGLIWRDFAQESGRGLISQLSRFWARRARRLLPAALLVLVSTFLAGLALGPRSWWLDSSGSFFASLAYVANWYFGFEEADYLRADTAVSPYQHFWSLSVEEQFYVLWPLLVILVVASAVKKKLNLTMGLLAVGSVASGLFSIYLLLRDPSFAFYNTFGRIWEFGLGGLLALAQRKWQIAIPRLLYPLSWLVLIAVMFVPHTQLSILPITALALLAGVVAIAAGEGRLSGRPYAPLHWVGDYSYGIYLWHWPIFILAPWVIGNSAIGASWREQLALVGLTLLLAFLSKNLVEDPIRFGQFAKLRNLTQISILLGISAVIFVSFAQVERAVRAELAQPVSLSPTIDASESPGAGEQVTEVKVLRPSLAELNEDRPAVEQSKYRVNKDEDDFIVAEFGNRESDVVIALVGDSHARQYFDPLFELVEEYDLALDVVSKTACNIQHPDDYRQWGGGLYCEKWNGLFQQHMTASSYDLIITSNSTLLHDGNEAPARSFAAAVTEWLETSDQVLVIRDNPKPVTSDTITDFKYCIERYGLDAERECLNTVEKALTPPDGFYDIVADIPGVARVDLTLAYCPDGISCPAVMDGMIVYRDASHISATFARTLTDELEAELSRLGIIP